MNYRNDLQEAWNSMNEDYVHWASGVKITDNMDHIRIKDRVDKWYVIDSTERGGKKYFLLEHETYGDEAGWLVVDEDGKEIAETWDDIDTALDDEGIEESLDEDMMHKDYHIKKIDNRGEYWWEDDETLYYVPELSTKFTSKKDAIDSIDAVVKYEKEHKDDKLRKEIMLAYAEREKKLKVINDRINEIVKDIYEHRNEFKSLAPVTEDEVREMVSDIIKEGGSIIGASNWEKIISDVLELNGEEEKEPNQQKVLDFYDGTLNLAHELDKISKNKALMDRPAGYNLIKGYVDNRDGVDDLLYDDDLEKRDFPYYVVVYDGGAVYEPAEGGYYVDTVTAVYSKGFKMLSDARKYARKLADQEELPKINDDLYEYEGKYVGDYKAVAVEKSSEYLQRTSKYHGYS